MSNRLEALRRPAIKAGMGNWTYYISTLTYKQLAAYVKMPEEVYKSKETGERVQREIDDDHVQRIVTYLKMEDDRFFDSIVLSVMGGKPRWFPGVFEKEGESYYSIGILELSGDEGIFPIDGQHRVKAIKNIADTIDSNGEEEIPVIFISHGDEEKGKEKMRRLFTSLNRYAKPINLADFIALDEDDIVAITTRYLSDNLKCMKDKIFYSKSEALSRDDKKHFINIISFYKCNDYLLNTKGKDKIEYKRFRPIDDDIINFQKETESFWKSLIEENKDVKEFFKNGVIENQRGSNGGNLLFRPRGIDPYVEAVAFIHEKHPSKKYSEIMRELSKHDMELDSNIWRDVLWNGEILTPGQAFMRDLFIMLYDKNLLTKKRQKTIIEKLCEKKGITQEEVLQIMKGNEK